MYTIGTPDDLLRPYNFTVFIESFEISFAKISGFEISVDTEILAEGGVNDRVYSLAKPASNENIMRFERGVSNRGESDTDAMEKFAPGKRLEHDVVIIVLKQNGDMARAMFLSGVYVKKMSYSDLDAMNGNQVLIETFEVAYEELSLYEGNKDL